MGAGTAALREVPAAAEAVDRHVFRSELVAVGTWRCPPQHPLFRDSGPIRDHCFTFPRTPTIIQRAGRRVTVDPTVAELYGAGEEYGRRAVGGHAAECDYFAVAAAVFLEALRELDVVSAEAAFPRFPVETVKVEPSLYLRQRQVFRAVAAGGGDPLAVEEAVLDLLASVLAAARTRPPRAEASPRRAARRRVLADEARLAVAAGFAEGASLGELARRLGSSPFHLCRVFREHTGRTLHRYRVELRLRAALARLEQGADVSTVAHAVGFSSHSHFTAEFRATFGLTPSTFVGRGRQTRGTARGPSLGARA